MEWDDLASINSFVLLKILTETHNFAKRKQFSSRLKDFRRTFDKQKMKILFIVSLNFCELLNLFLQNSL